MRKSQVSLFIILGLALLLIAGLIAFMVSIEQNRQSTGLEEQYAIKDSLKPVKSYIESCLAQSAEEPIRQIGLNGGTLSPVFYIYYYGEKINFLSYREPGAGINSILTRQEIEKELAADIKTRSEKCIDLGIFEKQGFVIEQGVLEINVSLTRSRAEITAQYPLTFSKSNQSMKITDYTTEVFTPLGEAFETAIGIINQELTQGYFDQVDFSIKHADYIIEKHRPYPHTVYLINLSGYAFRFAIEGEKEVNQPDFMLIQSQDTMGCCINRDRMCYANAIKDVCETKGGTYSASPCVCPAPVIADEECKNCKSCRSYSQYTMSFTGQTRQSGESWCSYDSITGDGYDYVGSRHYVHYCLDGVEYVEECRDYRQELCTEDSTSPTIAMCRPNRWQDCSLHNDRASCEDKSMRDCIWKDWISAKGKCVPQVPPGLEFWDSSAANICASGSELKTCEGWTCPAVWVDDAAMYCYMRGDCGAYRNINDRITYGGYFNTDFGSLPRSYIYHKDGENRKGDDYALNLGTGNRNRGISIPGGESEAQNTMVMMITSAYSYLSEISSLSISDFLNPFKPRPIIKVIDASICSPWIAPLDSADCSKCEERFKPCTEYRCKSLGQACIYEDANGFPTCTAAPDDKTPPKVALAEDFLPSYYAIKDSSMKIGDKTYSGYEITPALRPHKVFSIGIETDEETTCRLTYTPRIKYINPPSFGFGDSAFSTRHAIMVRVPEGAEVPEKMLAAFNLSRASDIIKTLEKPKDLMQNYKSRFAGPLAAYRFVTGKDLTSVIDPMVKGIVEVVDKLTNELPFYRDLWKTLIEKFEDGGLYLFVVCTDKSGNQNVNEMFIDISIDKNLNDSEPPMIVGFFPANGTKFANSLDKKQVSVFADEPSECRFSYTDMPYELMEEMECQSGRYEFSPHFGGSYECKTVLNLSDVTKIYIMCSDNPSKREEYTAIIDRAEIAEAQPVSKYLNLTDAGFVASASMLSGAKIMMNQSPFSMQINMEDSMNCSYSYDGKEKQFGKCLPEEDLEVGQFACKGTAEFNETGMKEIELMQSSETLPQDGIYMDSDNLTVNLSVYAMPSVWVKNSVYSVAVNGSYSCIAANETDSWNLSCRWGDETICIGNFSGVSEKIRCMENSRAIVNISCQDYVVKKRNTNYISFVYVISRSQALTVDDFGPKDESPSDTIMWVKTSDNATCEYSKELILTKTPMEFKSGRYEAKMIGLVPGKSTYFVSCSDDYGNSVTQEVSWQVLKS